MRGFKRASTNVMFYGKMRKINHFSSSIRTHLEILFQWRALSEPFFLHLFPSLNQLILSKKIWNFWKLFIEPIILSCGFNHRSSVLDCIYSLRINNAYSKFYTGKTSSPKGNDAHLRAIIQSEKNRNINFSDA